MCTASWLREAAGYVVFFNRDELRSRPGARPPRRWRRHGVSFVAPQDSEGGGTWLAANEWGVTIGLLNLYRAQGAPSVRSAGGEFISRGLLMVNLADCASAAELMSRLDAEDLLRYRPFTLFCLDAEGEERVVDWSGTELSRRTAGELVPLISSSLVDGAARRERRRLLDRYRANGPLNPGRLLEFHRSHEPEKGPLSPCMHRPDAATVSLSVVEVGSSEVRMLYGGGAACEAKLEPGPIVPRR
jgi:hypothetical protein